MLGFCGGLSGKTGTNTGVDSRSHLRPLGKWLIFGLSLCVFGLPSPVSERARDWSAPGPGPRGCRGSLLLRVRSMGTTSPWKLRRRTPPITRHDGGRSHRGNHDAAFPQKPGHGHDVAVETVTPDTSKRLGMAGGATVEFGTPHPSTVDDGRRHRGNRDAGFFLKSRHGQRRHCGIRDAALIQKSRHG